MPSSPKLFHVRNSSTSPSYSHKSSVLALTSCLLIRISDFMFARTSFFSPCLGYNCSNRDSRTVEVFWGKAAGTCGDLKRHKVMGFVDIPTGSTSTSIDRRQSLRKTWLPPNWEGLQRLEEAIDLTFRFIMEKSDDKEKMFWTSKSMTVF